MLLNVTRAKRSGVRAVVRWVVFGAIVSLLPACGGEDGTSSENTLPPDLYDDYLEQISTMYEVADPPSVDIVRVVDPDEQLDLVAECMQEEGWPATAVKDGGLQYQNIPEQKSAMDEAFYVCFAQYPLAEEYLAVGEEYYKELYAYYTKELKPCLERQGVEVSEPPTWDSWMAVVETGSSDYWNPNWEIPLDENLDAIRRACPQSPD